MSLSSTPENSISHKKAALIAVGTLVLGILCGETDGKLRVLRQIRTNPAKVARGISGDSQQYDFVRRRFDAEMQKEGNRRGLELLEQTLLMWPSYQSK
jgi:hypothetical protein